jgi:hypothetical protein
MTSAQCAAAAYSPLSAIKQGEAKRARRRDVVVSVDFDIARRSSPRLHARSGGGAGARRASTRLSRLGM